MPLWTDPTFQPGYTVHPFQPHFAAGYLPSFNTAAGTGQQQFLAAMRAASGDVQNIMQQRQKEQIAGVLLQQAGPRYQQMAQQMGSNQAALAEYQNDVQAGEDAAQQSLADQMKRAQLRAAAVAVGDQPPGQYGLQPKGRGTPSDKVPVTLPDGTQAYVTGNQAARMQIGPSVPALSTFLGRGQGAVSPNDLDTDAAWEDPSKPGWMQVPIKDNNPNSTEDYLQAPNPNYGVKGVPFSGSKTITKTVPMPTNAFNRYFPEGANVEPPADQPTLAGTPTPQQQPPTSDARAQAVQILQQNGKPITEANIGYVLQQLGQQ